MSANDADDHDALPPELLAAYADGELTPAECRRVEAWLAAHPEARADVEAQRRLARLFDEAAPPVPAEERWAEALAQVEQRPGRTAARPARRAAVAAAALAAAAAVLLLALALKDPPPRATFSPWSRTPPADEEPWAVVSADDVEILSMDDRDRGALVVGEPPVNEPMELLTEDEVQVNKLPDANGRAAPAALLHGAEPRTSWCRSGRIRRGSLSDPNRKERPPAFRGALSHASTRRTRAVVRRPAVRRRPLRRRRPAEERVKVTVAVILANGDGKVDDKLKCVAVRGAQDAPEADRLPPRARRPPCRSRWAAPRSSSWWTARRRRSRSSAARTVPAASAWKFSRRPSSARWPTPRSAASISRWSPTTRPRTTATGSSSRSRSSPATRRRRRSKK